jgi:hypothetical protein
MVCARLFRLVCVLTLLMLPTFPSDVAAQSGPAETFSGVFTRLSTWWATVWAEAGCYIDPSGGCAPEAPAPSNADGGCYIDPYGGCRDRS